MTNPRTQAISHNKYYNWIIKNLFSSWVNSLITIVSLIFIYEIGSLFLNWAIFAADFRVNFKGEVPYRILKECESMIVLMPQKYA